MNCYLIVDFGSTYTKLNLIDIDKEELIVSSSAHTTIETCVTDGFEEAFDKIKAKVDIDKVNIVDILGCSSAGGGLKMVAIGITPEFTVEAAITSALGAGARLLNTYSYFLKEEDILGIKALSPDIILLAGGAEKGNKSYIIHNAKQLVNIEPNIPIVVAGNSDANNEIRELFESNNMNFVITENIMPDVNRINPDNAREEIRKIFMDQIVYANGMEKMEKVTNEILMPTPTAVLKAAELLSKGTEKYSGVGDVMVVDIGGATTDIHTISQPLKDKSFLQEGLESPFEKRTVEGDLGMRYSAISLYENVGEDSFTKYDENLKNIKEKCIFRKENPEYIPQNKEERDFDEIMAKNCVAISTKRHCGKTRRTYINEKNVIVQNGKDLRDIKYIIGTGGVIVKNKNPKEILAESTGTEENLLLPKSPEYYVDANYIMSAMGVLSMKNRDLAYKILLENLINL